MKYFISLLLMGLLLTGCTSVHNTFIENMDAKVSDYSDFKKYRNRLYDLNDEYLSKISKDTKGNKVYHYKRHTGSFKDYCEYYIVVDPKDKTIIDWGFENDKTSKYCAIYT